MVDSPATSHGKGRGWCSSPTLSQQCRFRVRFQPVDLRAEDQAVNRWRQENSRSAFHKSHGEVYWGQRRYVRVARVRSPHKILFDQSRQQQNFRCAISQKSLPVPTNKSIVVPLPGQSLRRYLKPRKDRRNPPGANFATLQFRVGAYSVKVLFSTTSSLSISGCPMHPEKQILLRSCGLRTTQGSAGDAYY